MIFYYQRFSIFFGIILICEIIQLIEGQDFKTTLLNLIFEFLLFVISGKLVNFVSVTLTTWVIFELFSYFITHKGFNIQIMMAIDMNWILKNQFFSFLVVVFACLSLVILVFTRWGFKYVFIHNSIFYLSLVALFPLSFLFFSKIYTNLFPFQLRVFSEHSTLEFQTFFDQPINVSLKTKKPKNLILIEMESVENQLINPINFEGGMPFLQKISKTGTVFTNLIPQPYTVWSVASTFAVHCNMPLFLPVGEYNNGQTFHLNKKHKCIGDYLHLAGYDLHSYMTNFFVGRFAAMLKIHHWKTFDKNQHGLKEDVDVFDLVMKEVLPNLTASNRPFALHIANTDTHPSESFVDPRCEPRQNNSCQSVRSLDCFDQILDKFLTNFEKNYNIDDFLVVLYGDHPIMINYVTISKTKCIKIKEPRLLSAFFPYLPHKIVDKKASLYDLAPTILDLLDVEYSPKFPHGVNLFSKEVGRVPDDKSYDFIYTYFSGFMDGRWENKTFDEDAWIRIGQSLQRPKRPRPANPNATQPKPAATQATNPPRRKSQDKKAK